MFNAPVSERGGMVFNRIYFEDLREGSNLATPGSPGFLSAFPI